MCFSKKTSWLLTLLILGFNMTGCGGLFNLEPFVDSKKDEKGNVVLLDTNRNWVDWREAIDPQIESEIEGLSAPGFPSWNEKWLRLVAALEANQENHSKYVNYLIKTRREAGLPELER